MTAVDELVVTVPGLYPDIPDDVYHADPVHGGSLSSTGARRILPPSCPALFRHEQLHGRPDRRTFDIGHAAHKMVLGAGPDIVVVQKTAKDGTRSNADSYATKSAQEHRDEIRAAGGVPVLRDEYDAVLAMADALRAHPIAGTLLEPGTGRPEVSGFHIDQRSDAWLRVRYDWLPHPSDGRLIIPDYKTAISASPERFSKSAADYGYHQQDAFYTDAARALEIADDVSFVFVVQEKTAPYLVTVCELDPVAKRIGRNRNRQAIDLFAACRADDEWPTYTDDVALISLPTWYERRQQEDL